MDKHVFNDVVHGNMKFNDTLFALINTKQIQRLKNIKQLGMCHYVYPSASHSRFEHSLGTAYLAGVLYDRLTGESNSDTKLAIQIAALFHDVGHGPFSHTWEKFMNRVNPERQWRHEEESVKIFEKVLNETVTWKSSQRKVKDILQVEVIKDVKNFILGIDSGGGWNTIVNNQKFEIDVDKWDYLMRDSLMLNVPIGFNYTRLLDFCLLSGGSANLMYYRDKVSGDIVEMFLARHKLHEVAYQHPKVVIIEDMLLDALELANERLGLSTTPIEELTDHIYYKILYDDFGNDKKMKKARDILLRIESRDLYQCIASCTYKEPPSELKIMGRLALVDGFDSIANDIGICKTVNLLKNDIKVNVRNKNCESWYKDLGKIIEELIKYSNKLNQVFILYKGKTFIKYDLKESLKNEFFRVVSEEDSHM